MLAIYKNKGLLVPVYLIVCFFGTAEIHGVLHRNFGGAFSKIDMYIDLGFTFLLAAVWTYLTKDSSYKDKNGNKKKLDTVNSLFFIRMNLWAYIFLAASLIFFGNQLFHYFGS